MTIRSDKTRYSITLFSSTYNVIDYVSKVTNLTRSQVIESMITLAISKTDNLDDMIKYVAEENDTILD